MPRTGGDGGRGEAAEPLERVHDELPLEVELRRIVKVLQRAAAAGRIGRAGGAHALRRGRERFARLGHGIAGRDLDHMRAHALVRQRAGHEHGVALRAGDALPLAGERGDLERQFIVLFDGRHPVLLH